MRLMLGTKERPSLLVDVQQEKSPSEFDFWVINGAWDVHSIMDMLQCIILGIRILVLTRLKYFATIRIGCDVAQENIKMCSTTFTMKTM